MDSAFSQYFLHALIYSHAKQKLLAERSFTNIWHRVHLQNNPAVGPLVLSDKRTADNSQVGFEDMYDN